LDKDVHLWIGQFATLQTGHVTSQTELLAMESFQILFPLHYLIVNLLLSIDVRDHRLLKIRHMLHLVILQQLRVNISQLPFLIKEYKYKISRILNSYNYHNDFSRQRKMSMDL